MSDPDKDRRLELTNIIHQQLGGHQSNEEFFQFKREKRIAETELDARMERYFGTMQRESSTRDLIWRCGSAAEELVDKKRWYMIHFTLSVAGSYFDVLSGRRWSAFTQELKRITCFETFGRRTTPPGFSQQDYFAYAAVVEGPEIGKRPHVHMIAFMRSIPSSWKTDPNLGKLVPSRMEIPAAKSVWKHGISSPRVVRTDMHDPWADLGHKWPVYDGEPLPELGAGMVASYIGKYHGKETIVCRKTTRARMSRKLGLNNLLKTIGRLPLNLLKELNRPWTMACPELWSSTWPSKRLMSNASKRVRISRIKSRWNLLNLIQLRELKRSKPQMNLFKIMSERLQQLGVGSINYVQLRTHLGEVVDEVSDEIYMIAEECELKRFRRAGIAG